MSDLKAMKTAITAVGEHKKLRKAYDKAVQDGNQDAIASAKNVLADFIIVELLPAVQAVKGTSTYWGCKETEFEAELNSLLTEDPAPAASSTVVAVLPAAASSNTNPPAIKRPGNTEHGQPNKKPARFALGSKKKSSTGSAKPEKIIGGTANKITDQSNRFTRLKEANVAKHLKEVAKYDNHVKILNQKATPADMQKAKREGWPRTVHLHITYDSVKYAGRKGGRIGAGKERRDHPVLTIRSAGPFNQALEEEALSHARVVMQQNLFKDGDGKQTMRYRGGRKVDVVYKTLLSEKDFEESESQLDMEDAAAEAAEEAKQEAERGDVEEGESDGGEDSDESDVIDVGAYEE